MRPAISQNQFLFLAEATAWRYWSAGRFVHGFLLGKLKHDPVYRELLNLPCWDRKGRVVDLGCGHGLTLALLATARGLGLLPGGKSGGLELLGIERDPATAQTARRALADQGEILTQDVRTAEIPPCRAVLLIDLLYHLDPPAQEILLRRAAAALEPAGTLIIREADAGGGWRYAATWLAEWLRNLGRGHPGRQRHYRRQEGWRELLEKLGFTVEVRPMSQGTPFANVLFIGRRPDARTVPPR